MSHFTDLFPTLPEGSGIWIHVADRKLTDSEAETLRSTLARFVRSWTSHERQVLAEIELFENRILLLGAFVPDGDLSGCGIDKHLHVIDELARNLHFEWAGPLSVVYRDGSDQIKTVSRSEFARLVTETDLPASTPIFETGISLLSEARAGIEREASLSWLSKFFPQGEELCNDRGADIPASATESAGRVGQAIS